MIADSYPLPLRPISDADRAEVAELIYCSINYWYEVHGRAPIFRGGPGVTEVFYEVYNDLNPGSSVVAVNPRNGRMMGACFYHPREHHVGLGIMAVHPNYFCQGVGRALLTHVVDFADANHYKSVRLTQSALNVESFSLYNKAGFVPRYAFQDMIIEVPATGFAGRMPGMNRVRAARLEDVPAMGALEMEVSGISRVADYRYCIENRRGYWHGSVIEGSGGTIDGFLICCSHPAMTMLGPGVSRTEVDAAALVCRGLDVLRGRTPVVLIPTDKEHLVRQMYAWGARNCEMHFCQVRGPMQPFRGVSLPSFLPETA